MGSVGVKKLVVAMMVAVALSLYYGGVAAEPQVPCLFVFGDSLSDSGNNNNLQTLAKVNYMPYGIDFSMGPTGRFTNGKTFVDVISKLLGFDNYIPPYHTARGQEILKGVNYASGSAGIRSETGQHWGGRIDFTTQVKNYKNNVEQVVKMLGGQSSAKNHLRKCIYSIGVGSNDYLNNYFLPQYYHTSRQYSPEQYAGVLIQQYSEQLKALYNIGARKFVLFGIAQTGCTPYALAQNNLNGSTCVKNFNDANNIFNNKLKALVDEFNRNTKDAHFIYINSYGIFEDLVKNPSNFGFKVTNAGCCGAERKIDKNACHPLQIPCQNRNQYMFWDAYHSTEAVNIIVGNRSYIAQKPSDAHPYDIHRLVQL